MQFDDNGGLLTFEKDGVTHCLGYLFYAENHGVYDAVLGKVDITREVAERHNKVYDEALIKGLDETCEVGQGSNFYRYGKEVRTWIGTVVGQLSKVGRSRVLVRNGRRFECKCRKGEESVFLQRIE